MAKRSLERAVTLALVWCVCTCRASRSVIDAYDRRVFFATHTRSRKAPTDPVVQAAAEFAIQELQTLSDSGVYRSLSLATIQDAAAEVGDFHYMLHLNVTLASPYFVSAQSEEDFALIYLEAKPPAPGSRETAPAPAPARRPSDAPRSIAINEFPVMRDDAIEAFWVEMVEARRRKRRALFQQWLSEADGDDESSRSAAGTETSEQREPPDSASTSAPASAPETTAARKPKKKLSLDALHAMPSSQLRTLLATREVSRALRDAITRILDARWKELARHEARDEL